MVLLYLRRTTALVIIPATWPGAAGLECYVIYPRHEMLEVTGEAAPRWGERRSTRAARALATPPE
ncbi:MAG: hypothetical protein NFW16_06315 [Candidatus Accumulibacter sp.]|uniref:hypothetical protein n=1 Tax=Accumulibacter sp. TaxID=2053492 RepID=UPI00258A0428|nr:hypothetical protein [Accumulibacter sp.]MCM8621351.1 hypothetical protein [Accumulibacter sp.]